MSQLYSYNLMFGPAHVMTFSRNRFALCHGTGKSTYVEYVLYMALVMVRFGRWSVSSQLLCPCWSRASSVGGLSTIYDIHACHPGGI